MKGSHPTQRVWLRLLDAAGAMAALILLAPLFAIATLLILICDGRPILFRQPRIGKGGEPFLILKFRTMRTGCAGLAITSWVMHRTVRAAFCGAPQPAFLWAISCAARA
jgi:lipopolysaccharide/colanic/teichoic acid biosynthesis glycosyltransferase